MGYVQMRTRLTDEPLTHGFVCRSAAASGALRGEVGTALDSVRGDE